MAKPLINGNFFMNEQNNLDVFNITEYCLPGIYRIDSLETQRSLFCDADNVFFEMREFFDNVRQGNCENQEFLEDFKTYGSDNFQFIVLNVGPEFVDKLERKKLLERYKKTWKEGLY